MICEWLKSAIDHIIADNQAAFIQGRSLVHNILICHDLPRHYNRKTTPRCLMKIDLKKAYNMVRWEFLEDVLKGYGFPMPFIQLIMMCVTTITFTIKVNGAGYGYFEGKGGLKQGDPMSLLLFVLVIEYLSRGLNKMSELPDFQFHPMCKNTKLTHLIIADDLMLFCKGNIQSIHRIMEVVNHFSEVSGMVANMEKSNIFLAGMDEATKQVIVRDTGLSVYIAYEIPGDAFNIKEVEQSRISSASGEDYNKHSVRLCKTVIIYR